jgi:hypothetical protein
VHGGGLATIYADNNGGPATNGTPLANPFQANLDGSAIFYAQNGRYDIQTTSPATGQIFTYLDVLLCDPAVPGSICGAGGGGMAPHNLLSTTHLDTIPFSPPVRGDVITAQAMISPAGTNPSWARLALGPNTYVLTSNGTDAIWAPAGGGSGCTLPGLNFGVLSEHPAGTCYDSVHWTWDDTTNRQVMQAGISNTVGSNANDAFIWGGSNNVRGATTVSQSRILGDNNVIGPDGINQENYLIGTGNTQDNLGYAFQIGIFNFQQDISADNNFTFGDNNQMFSNTPGTQTHIGECFTIGRDNIIKNNPGAATITHCYILGSDSTISANFSSGSELMEDIALIGDGNQVLGSVNSFGSLVDIHIMGDDNTVEDLTNNVAEAQIVGAGNLVNGASSTVQVLGLDNTATNVTIPVTGDATQVGWNNTMTGAPVTNNTFAIEVGSNLTETSCSDCYLFGRNGTTSTDNFLGVGLSAVPEIQITTTSTQIAYDIANAGATGTTINHLAKLTTANPSTVIVTTAGDTSGVVGVVMGNAGTTGSAQVAFSGMAICTFDGATTAGHYVQISASVNGDCTDSGAATFPGSNQVIGRVLSTNGGGGNYQIILYMQR